MDWRWFGRLAAALLLLGAGLVLLLDVQVRGASDRAGSCGSAWDVVSGRADWQQWWTHDLADPIDGSGGRPVRTVLCPDAVNTRTAASAGLAAAAVVIMAAGEVVHRRRAPRAKRIRHGLAAHLAVFGTVATMVGGVLTVAGIAGITLLVADPDDPLFLYVSRPAVVLVGLVLLLPAVLLVALGWLASLLADQLPPSGASHDAP